MTSRIGSFSLAVGMMAAGCCLASPGMADDGMMRVYMNQARVLKLDRPVSKVIIGNADVADATVADAKTIVLTGRAFGTTNLVLLDSEGNVIVDERILVSIDEGNTVRVFKATERTVLSCTPNCEIHAEVGGAPTASN